MNSLIMHLWSVYLVAVFYQKELLSNLNRLAGKYQSKHCLQLSQMKRSIANHWNKFPHLIKNSYSLN